MKMKFATVLVFLYITVMISGCTSSDHVPPVLYDEDDFTWVVFDEKKFDFIINMAGYYDDKNAICVGNDGVIEYLDSVSGEWLPSENTSMCLFGMDIVNEEICYACGNGAYLQKSTDGGKTFVGMADVGDFEPNHCKLLSFCDRENGLAASDKTLSVTSDGAASWTAVKVPDQILAVYMETPDKFCFIGKSLKLYSTQNCGASWDETPLNLPDGNDYLTFSQNFTLSVDSGNITVFCISSKTRTLKSYSSADGMKSWSENPIPQIDADTIVLNINRSCDIITLCDLFHNSIVAMKKK